jgi:glycosyltransferase involved in cell wall biosynthesis
MRIGIISTMGGVAWGGSEELWSATAFEAIEAGHEVMASVFGWTNESPKLRELESRGAKVFRRYNRDFRVQGRPFGAASSFGDLFKTNPDVIVINQGNSFDILDRPELLELLYVTPIPFVLICHLNENLPLLAEDNRREHVRNIFARSFRVLFVSNQNRLDAERQLAWKIPNSDLVLNPVNLSDRSPIPWYDSGTARFANVARLSAKPKGQDILIEALSADQWRQRDWHLSFYGSGPDERYLRSLVEFYELQARITFAGYQRDVRAIWAQEQVLVMFSRAEGTPLALVEAMLCGRPAIVSDVGGNQEWITETRTGFVAEAPVIGLARATLERAWSARQSWKTMGTRAHEFASDRLSDPSIRGLLQVLLEAGRQKSPAAGAIGEEPVRMKQYRRLMEPTIRRRAKRVAEAGVSRLKDVLSRWRAARERSLLQLAEPNKTASPGTNGATN